MFSRLWVHPFVLLIFIILLFFLVIKEIRVSLKSQCIRRHLFRRRISGSQRRFLTSRIAVDLGKHWLARLVLACSGHPPRRIIWFTLIIQSRYIISSKVKVKVMVGVALSHYSETEAHITRIIINILDNLGLVVTLIFLRTRSIRSAF
jgi:hypothetical protein